MLQCARRVIVLLLLSGLVTQPAWAAERYTLQHEGEAREYFVRLPNDFEEDTTYWLLVTAHGGNGNGRDHFLGKDMRRYADSEVLNAIVVSPTFSRTDRLAARFPALGESAFLDAVLADCQRRYKLHPKILLTGSSQGGQLVHRYALANPDKILAVAPLSAGTWSTPDGMLLLEGIGLVSDPHDFLNNPDNKDRVPERLQNMFTLRVTEAATRQAHKNAASVPYLIMCGTLDPRLPMTQHYVTLLMDQGFRVETRWPHTPHTGRDKEAFKAEFKIYPETVMTFFKRWTSKKE